MFNFDGLTRSLRPSSNVQFDILCLVVVQAVKADSDKIVSVGPDDVWCYDGISLPFYAFCVEDEGKDDDLGYEEPLHRACS